MPDLVPIKVIIRKKNDGGALYPNFNQIDGALRSNMRWSTFIDSMGIGWHYDKIANIGTGEETGTCCTCVPKGFADAAIAMFPADVSKMTEVEFGSFHDDRAHAHESEDNISLEVLQSIQVREALGIVIPANEKANILNRDHPSLGIRRNRKKKWQTVKQDRKVTIVQ